MRIRKLRQLVADITPKKVKEFRRKLISETFSIIKNPVETLDVVYKIKEETWEDTYYPECYGHCKEQHLSVYNPKQYIFTSNNAIAISNSDVVITSKGVYWDKYNEEEFVTWAIPADSNLSWFNRDEIGIYRKKDKEYVKGYVLSLLGTWAHHWGHCMYQFLPKLYIAGDAGLLMNDITILITEKEDHVILGLIKSYLKDFPKAKIKFAKENTEYICEKMYFMPSLGSSFNNQKFRLDYPYYISSLVLGKIRDNVVAPIIDKVKNDKPKYDKIFLPRPNTGADCVRTLNNYEEIHNYFLGLGYVDIEGANLNLEEKASIFYHAKEIVALYGSSILNLAFCNHAKCMVFLNYKMSTDTSLYLMVREHLSTYINVTGQDDNENYHTNYYIPLEKVKRVYDEYIREK